MESEYKRGQFEIWDQWADGFYPSSNLVKHAIAEMRAAGWESDDPSCAAIIHAVAAFSGGGWSGGSVGAGIGIMNKLLQFQPLTGITDDPDEWHHVAEGIAGEPNLYQSTRHPACFSHDGGKTYYNLDELPVHGMEWWRVSTWKRRFTNRWFGTEEYLETWTVGGDKRKLKIHKSESRIGDY